MAGKPLHPLAYTFAVFGLLVSPVVVDSDSSVQAGCCNNGPPVVPYAYEDGLIPSLPQYMPMPTPAYQPPPITQTKPVERPPGTLGYTYKQKSDPVPIDDHPRTAKLQVRNASTYDLKLEGVQKFNRIRGDDGVWYFESDVPLLPGVPHIYKLKVKTYDGPSGEAVYGQEYYLRLIPGRIVYFAF